MKLGLIPLAVLVFIFCLAASSALATFDIQDLPPSKSPAASQATDQSATSNQANTPAEPKKAKRVWTNENLTEVSGSAISQIGDAKNGASRKALRPSQPALRWVASFGSNSLLFKRNGCH